MTKHFFKITVLVELLFPFHLSAQYEGLTWIAQLAEEIVAETDLCERCNWVNPTISYVRLNNGEYIFLRYSCSSNESFARMYSLDGIIESECLSINGSNDCGFGGNAFTIYTFADEISPIWNCATGFECAFATENDIDLVVPITVDDSRCAEGIKILKAAETFASYNWQGNNQMGETPTLEINEGGLYYLTVTDEIGCIFEGTIDIPDIARLEVNIKGPAQFCLGTEVEIRTTDFTTYQWASGETESSIIANQAGVYQVTVTNDQNCEGTASFLLENYRPSTVEIVASPTSVFEGDSVNVAVISPTSSQLLTVESWESKDRIDCRTCPTATYFPKVENELSVSVIDENGCRSTTSLSLDVKALTLAVYAPNIFRPSSLTENNYFTIYSGANVAKIEQLSVFDRWGNLIYTKKNFPPNNRTDGWDGRKNGAIVPQNIYLYQATVLFTNGTSKIISGDVLLLH